MSRFIDADILDNEVMHLFIAITGNPKQSTVVNECKSTFRRMIEEQPTAEVVTVVHGEWIPYRMSKLFSHTCSICKCDVEEKTPYCPYCGADMRKRE